MRKLTEIAKINRAKKRSEVIPYPTEHRAIRDSADPDPTIAEQMMDRDNDYQYRSGAWITDISDHYGRQPYEF